MSDTPTDRLSRARYAMDQVQKRLEGLMGFSTYTAESTRELTVVTAAHSRALRELFLATLEAAEPPKPKPATYTADGPTYRRLRHRAEDVGETALVAAIDRLCDFEGTEDDVRLVARHLVLAGEHDLAASLLRNVEG